MRTVLGGSMLFVAHVMVWQPDFSSAWARACLALEFRRKFTTHPAAGKRAYELQTDVSSGLAF